MTGGALYSGFVSHVRPGAHRLRYRVFMLALDLDALGRVAERLKFFGHNRGALCAVYDCDHGARRDAPLRPQIEAKLRAAGIAFEGGRIVLVTMPRILGYVFNPLSVYFCHRDDGGVAAIVYEVRNTFGETHSYVLPVDGAGENGAIAQDCDKAFFVSPFLEMGLRYEFRVRAPGETFELAMIVRRGREVALTASFSGARKPLSDGALFAAWARDPLMTVKVIAGIHWEALKMWAKGVRYLGRRGARGAA